MRKPGCYYSYMQATRSPQASTRSRAPADTALVLAASPSTTSRHRRSSFSSETILCGYATHKHATKRRLERTISQQGHGHHVGAVNRDGCRAGCWHPSSTRRILDALDRLPYLSTLRSASTEGQHFICSTSHAGMGQYRPVVHTSIASSACQDSLQPCLIAVATA